MGGGGGRGEPLLQTPKTNRKKKKLKMETWVSLLAWKKDIVVFQVFSSSLDLLLFKLEYLVERIRDTNGKE